MTKQKQKIKSEFVWEKLIENLTRKKQQIKHARLAKKIEKARIKKKRTKVFVCKRWFVKFSNNIKLHQHVQNHHQKKFATKSLKYIFTSFSNELVLFVFNEIVSFSKQFFISSLISLSTFFIILFTFIEFILFIFIEFILFIFIEFTLSALSTTLFATSKKRIFWAKIVSKFISSKFSRLSLSILEFLRTISSQISTSTKTYLTMNNLFVMFNKKSKSLDLSHCQKHTFSQHYWRLSKLVIFFFIELTSRHIFYRVSIRSNSTFCRN